MYALMSRNYYRKVPFSCNLFPSRLFYTIMTTIQLSEQTGKGVISQSALQVKMFIHTDPNEAEQSVSQWLKQNDVAIDHITQSQSEKNGKFVFVLTVFYRQNN
jgi:hypothetical protein